MSLSESIPHAQSLIDSGKPESAMDFLLDLIDENLYAGNFDQISEVMGNLDPAKCDSEIVMTWICATLPARSRIRNRSELMARFKDHLMQVGEWKPTLLDGLE